MQYRRRSHGSAPSIMLGIRSHRRILADSETRSCTMRHAFVAPTLLPSLLAVRFATWGNRPTRLGRTSTCNLSSLGGLFR